jgi:hypothetical protein
LSIITDIQCARRDSRRTAEIYISDEALETLGIVDALASSPSASSWADGEQPGRRQGRPQDYVGIAQGQGALTSSIPPRSPT